MTPMCTEFKDRQAAAPSDALGHEAAGVVVDAADSTIVRPGDRVVVMPSNGCGTCWLCTGGDHIYCQNRRDVLAETGSSYGTATYAEYVIKPDWLLLPIPADISLRHAALACCGLGPTFNALERLRTTALDTVLISGCGPVGLGGVVNAVARGARVIALEPTAYRAKLARALGAEHVLTPYDKDVAEQVKRMTGGRGADCALETSGAREAPTLLLSALRPLGRMALIAWGADLSLPPLPPSGVEVHGCWHWNHYRDCEGMWTTIRKSKVALDTMVTHEFAIEDVSRAMDIQDTAECGKVFLYPGGSRAVDQLASISACTQANPKR